MRAAHLLSGGVDSSLALKLMLESGYDAKAYYLKVWLEDELSFLGNCPWEEDIEFARKVCDYLNVPLEIINMQAEYLENIVDYTLKELKAGRTPSPDVMCNKHIKFGEFFKKIGDSFDVASSGHYATIEEKSGKYYLKESVDKVKDQTYFLTYLSQEQLSKIYFPIGSYTKSEVRNLADEYGLPSKSRPDSQGICFLGKIAYNDFIKFHLGEKSGEIVEMETGRILGKHKGYWYHTIGQRHGLGLSGGPWFVAKKDIEDNTVFVSKVKFGDSVQRRSLILNNINWIPELPSGKEFQIKLRHGPNKVNCELISISPSRAFITLEEPDQGIAAGQFGIIYKNGYCFGGGVIELNSENYD